MHKATEIPYTISRSFLEVYSTSKNCYDLKEVIYSSFSTMQTYYDFQPQTFAIGENA